MTAYLTLFFALFLFPKICFGQEVILNVLYGKMLYSYQGTTEDLSKLAGAPAAGLARSYPAPTFLDLEVTRSGQVKKIYLSGGYGVFLVLVACEYPVGSVYFEKILKHELTHVAVYRLTAEQYMANLATELLATLKNAPNQSKWEHLQNLQPIVNRYTKEMFKVGSEKSSLQDKPESYAYQNEQILEVRKEKKDKQETTCRKQKNGSSYCTTVYGKEQVCSNSPSRVQKWQKIREEADKIKAGLYDKRDKLHKKQYQEYLADRGQK